MNNEILYFEGGQVKVTEEGLSLVAFKSLYDSDKNTGKPLFKKYCTAIWNVYSKDNPVYYSTTVNERIEMYNDKIGKDTAWSSCLKDKRFIDCIKEYDYIVKTSEDRQIGKLIIDIENQILDMQNIPSTKKGKEKVKITNTETGEDEYKILTVDIPNTKERIDAQEAIKKSYAMLDFLKARLKANGEVKKKRYLRIFDVANEN